MAAGRAAAGAARVRRALAAAGLMVAAAGSAGGAEGTARPVEANAAARHGALFKISRAGHTAYVFGTVHVGAPAFYPLAPETTEALAAASTLVLELDTRDNAAFQRALAAHGLYPAGDSVRAHLSGATLARLEAALAAHGTRLDQVERLKPWLLANLLAGAALEQTGLHRRDGLEFFLLAQTQAHGAAVAELESAERQLALFDSLDDGDAERYLDETLAGLADGSTLRQARELIDAWYAADPAVQQQALAHATAGPSTVARFTRQVLLGGRNPAMADGIDRIVQGRPGTSFVGVGLLHLLGADGVPALLAQRGYAVERVY